MCGSVCLDSFLDVQNNLYSTSVISCNHILLIMFESNPWVIPPYYTSVTFIAYAPHFDN